MSVLVALLNLSVTAALASPPKKATVFGALTVSGVVTVNEVVAMDGATILSGSHIITASKADSVLELGNFTRLILFEQTDLKVDFSADSISGSLREGRVRAFIPADRSLILETPDGEIVTDSCAPVLFSVQVQDKVSRISVETGRVELRSGNDRRTLGAGETFSISPGSLNASVVPQDLNKKEGLGIVAGFGASLAILLIAITGREKTEEFGGCAIVPSGSNDGPGVCR